MTIRQNIFRCAVQPRKLFQTFINAKTIILGTIIVALYITSIVGCADNSNNFYILTDSKVQIKYGAVVIHSSGISDPEKVGEVISTRLLSSGEQEILARISPDYVDLLYKNPFFYLPNDSCLIMVADTSGLLIDRRNEPAKHNSYPVFRGTDSRSNAIAMALKAGIAGGLGEVSAMLDKLAKWVSTD